MTVSLKRLIAYVALVAITLAGTPTKLMANDGLKSERYGLKSDQQKIQTAQKARANLTENPFRNNTVTATLSGTSIQVDRATVAQSSVAIILPSSISAIRAIAANRVDPGESTITEVHGAVFRNQLGFYSSLAIAGQSAFDFAGTLADSAKEQLEMIAKA